MLYLCLIFLIFFKMFFELIIYKINLALISFVKLNYILNIFFHNPIIKNNLTGARLYANPREIVLNYNLFNRIQEYYKNIFKYCKKSLVFSIKSLYLYMQAWSWRNPLLGLHESQNGWREVKNLVWYISHIVKTFLKN